MATRTIRRGLFKGTRVTVTAPLVLASRNYSGSTYRLEWCALGWQLLADGVCIGGPYATDAPALAALDAVAPKD